MQLFIIMFQGRCVILRDRKLNIAPAIKKQTFCAPNETIYYAATHPGLMNNIPIEQFPPALYSPGEGHELTKKKNL